MPTPTQLRSDVATLADAASADLASVLRGIESATLLGEALRDVLPSLIEEYGYGAATLAADWYDETRDEVGVRGRFTAIPADIPDPGAYPLIGWAESQATEIETLRTLVAGGMQRRIANYSRLTVSRSSVADPGARGWKRIGTGRCDFCRMLIGRGAVYTEATADFESHDNCGCSAAPAWA